MNQHHLEIKHQYDFTGRKVPELDVSNNCMPRQDLLQSDRRSYRQDLQDLSKNASKRFSDPFSAYLYKPSRSSQMKQVPSTSQSRPRSSMLSSKMRLMVFIKIILKCLESDLDPNVRLKAKQVIAECTRKNREGDPDYTPLEDAIERRLRFAVDDFHWNKAKTLMDHYIATHSQKQHLSKPFKSKSPRYAQV